MNECVRCGAHYTHADNIGAWRCRYHPGTLVGDQVGMTRANTYTCCGASPLAWHDDYRGEEAASGCNRAHHRTARWHARRARSRNADGTLHIPLDRARGVFTLDDLAAESIDYDARSSTVIVHRREGGERHLRY